MLRKTTFILLAFTALVNAEMATTDDCGILYEGKYYKRELLKDNFERPYSLSVDRMRNILYFTYNLPNKAEDVFAAAALDLTTKKLIEIEGIRNAFTTAISKTGEVYLGNDRGIYMLNDAMRANLIHDVGEDIWSMYYSDDDDILIYITWPDFKTYVLQNGVASVNPLFTNIKMSQIGSDGHGHAFFFNSTALYVANMDSKTIKPLDFEHRFRCMAFDIHGHSLFGAVDGIYMANLEEKRLEKIYAMDGLLGLAFDKDNNLIYADNNALYRVIPFEGCAHAPAATAQEGMPAHQDMMPARQDQSMTAIPLPMPAEGIPLEK